MNATWHCWNASAVLDSCEPAVEACDQCTPLTTTPAPRSTASCSRTPSPRGARASAARTAFPTCAGSLRRRRDRDVASVRIFEGVQLQRSRCRPRRSTRCRRRWASAHDAFFAALHATERERRRGGVDDDDQPSAGPTTPEKKARALAMLMQLIVSLCVIMGLACLSASVAVFLVWERASASKHLQTVSGLHRGVFWAGTYTWDLLACFPADSFDFPRVRRVRPRRVRRRRARRDRGRARVVHHVRDTVGVHLPLAVREQHGRARGADGDVFLLRRRAAHRRRRPRRPRRRGRRHRDARLGRVGSYLSVAAALLRRPRAVHRCPARASPPGPSPAPPRSRRGATTSPAGS